MENKKCLNAGDVAEILGISRASVYALFHTEGFPVIRVSEKRFVVPASAFDRWLDTCGGRTDKREDDRFYG